MSKQRKLAKRATSRASHRKYRHVLDGDFKTPRPKDCRHRKQPSEWANLTEPWASDG